MTAPPRIFLRDPLTRDLPRTPADPKPVFVVDWQDRDDIINELIPLLTFKRTGDRYQARDGLGCVGNEYELATGELIIDATACPTWLVTELRQACVREVTSPHSDDVCAAYEIEFKAYKVWWDETAKRLMLFIQTQEV